VDRSRLERIKQALDIVSVVAEHVSLERKGGRLWGLCPFHSEKTPSFAVDAARQTFKCFGCGKGGDVFTFLMEKKGLSFAEAAEELAKRAGIEPEERPASSRRSGNKALYEANACAAEFFVETLSSPEGEPARRYLRGRGIDEATQSRFRIGYAPESWDALLRRLRARGVPPTVAERAGLVVSKKGGGYRDRFRGRVMFPIVDLSGEVAGFGGRIIGPGEPKYLNTSESPIFEKRRLVYNLHSARSAIRKGGAVVVEGYMDVVSLAQAGFDAAVATLGTALGEDHVRLLMRFTDDITLVFDGDESGRKAMVRAIEPFAASGVIPRVVILPQGKDPDDIAREGIEAFRSILETARDIWEFVFDESFSRNDPSKLRGQNAILKELTPMIAHARDPVLRDLLSHRLASRLGVSPDVVARMCEVRSADTAGEPGQGYGAERKGIETTLARLMVLDRAAASKVREKAPALEFSDAELQGLFDYMVKGGDDPLADPSCPDRVRLTASRLAAQGEFPGDAKKALIDTLFRFKSLAIDERLKRIQHELLAAERARDTARRNELLKEKQEAMIERRGLRQRIMEELEDR